MKSLVIATVVSLSSLACSVAIAAPPKKTPSKAAPALTADEALRTIHDGAQLGVGLSHLVEIGIYGSAVVKVESFDSFVSVTAHGPLNWRELEEATIEISDGNTLLTLRFKQPFDLVGFRLSAEDGSREPRKADTYDKVELTLPSPSGLAPKRCGPPRCAFATWRARGD